MVFTRKEDNVPLLVVLLFNVYIFPACARATLTSLINFGDKMMQKGKIMLFYKVI